MSPVPERRDGTLDRRHWDGSIERRQATSFSAEGPGGFKVAMRGGGFILGVLIGAASIAALWLWAVVKVVH